MSTRRRWRRTASGTALALALGTIVVLAYRYDGKPFTEVELNDGGVWVTNRADGLIARLNPQIKELDLGVDAASGSFDIFQRATDLFVDDDSADRSVKAVDIPRAAVEEPTALPTGAVVAHGGGTFAVVDPVSGKAWVRPDDGFATFSAKSAGPDQTAALSATVGPDGTAYVLGRDGAVTPYSVSATEGVVAQDSMRVASGLQPAAAEVALTVAGGVPVVYDRNTGRLFRPGADPLDVGQTDTTSVELQQPSGDTDVVYLAGVDGLYRTSLDGGGLTKVSRGPVAGAPAAPVVLDSARCVYAAWADPSSPNNYLRDCADDRLDDGEQIPRMEPTADLVFRVNRDVVVLNDDVTGDAWLVQEPGKTKVDNWPSVDPRNENRQVLKETTEVVPDQENRPPEPENDDLGARPGRTTVLPVVARNDHDPDGDIISIAKTQYMSGPELEMRIVGDGTQLQVAVPPDATGTAIFRYYVTDGKVNEQTWAEVRVQIRDDAQHAQPRMMDDRKPKMVVSAGATASYYVLADYEDLDGDDLTLSDATVRGGEVDFRPDGTITFTDTGKGARTTDIQYTVDDGRDTIVGTLPVQVVTGAAPPELTPDLTSGVAGTQVVVQPLANDRNPEGTDLTLKKVSVVGDDVGTKVSQDLESGTFTFKADRARSYYLEYSAYNATTTATSMVRIDVESPPKDNRPPVAVRDKAVITPGGTSQVDLLLNDFDPDGDVLVVTRIGRPSNPAVKVSIIDKRIAVVSAATDLLGQPAQVEYTASDGRRSVTGYLVVSQRQSTQANRHPVANKDQVTVRAGSVTSVPVLANDSDPDGGKPTLYQSDLVPTEGVDAWVAGDALRLRAPDRPGTYSVIYGVRDDLGLKATAEVSIFVVPDSAKNNRPPLPQPIIDRVISGRTKVIGVDLVSADPDGDSVAFRSILTAPSLGRIVGTGVDFLRYEAFEGRAGTDFFQILVQDKYGATGVAEVRVGVVPQEAVNQAPVALDDDVLVQPGRTISYNVLANDNDPDDDALRIDGLNSQVKASAERGLVQVPVGQAPENGTATTSVGYTIRDVVGASDNAVLTVTASRDAPFYAPVARDDVADLDDIIGRDPGETLEVPVLDNDLDFDGAKADLKVAACDAGEKGTCEVTPSGAVRVRLTTADQVVLYQLDDADDESSSTFGVIFVTGTDNVPPQVTTDGDLVPVKVEAGDDVELDLADLVVTRAGRSARPLPDTLPTAVNGAVAPVEGSTASLRFTPAAGYAGPASVTVSVTDGSSSSDDKALTSLLTIPITVLPTENVAPVMRGAQVDVTTEDPSQVDLAGLTKDLNKGDLSTMVWTVTSAEAGVTASVAPGDSLLTVEADGGVKDGDLRRIQVAADDGKGGTAAATIVARIVDNDRPLTSVPAIQVNAQEGEQVAVDLDDYAVNPFPGEPLRVSLPTIEGRGRLGDLVADGSVVRFTAVVSGTATVRVTVSDASERPERNVTARINVTVISPPDAPARPVLSSVEASSAVLTWREPDPNGAPIEEYEVTGSNGFKQSCTATTCRLVDLTPGDAYTFTVRARNLRGWGKPSPPSEQVVPNKAPDLMLPPSIEIPPSPTGTRVDRQLTLAWEAPTNEGSEITSYEIKEAGSGRTWQAGGADRSKTITGLTNGTPYAFEIRAVNKVEPRRQFSAASRAVAPFGVPLRSGTAPLLTASEANPYDAAPFVRIDWTAWSEAQSNGDPITGYEITCSGCSRSTYTVDASSTSRTFDPSEGIRKGGTYTFTVAATNDAGTSDRSPSVSGRPFTKPGPVRGLTEVGQSPDDKVATVGWVAPLDDGGLPISHYVVQLDNGATQQIATAPGAAGTPLTFAFNGQHSIRVATVTRNGDKLIEGPSEYLGKIATWGPPQPPPDTASTSGDYYAAPITLRAGAPDGLPILGVEYSTDGGNTWTAVKDGTYLPGAVDEGATVITYQVRTVSAATDDRRTSSVTTMRPVSKTPDLSALKYCNDNGCVLRAAGNGFRRQDNTATFSLNGLSNPDNCQLTFTVQGSFSNAGPGCRFPGSGTGTVEVRGRTAVAVSP